MAAIFYTFNTASVGGQKPIFQTGFGVNLAVQLPFLSNILTNQTMVVVTDVSIVNRDTIQYFVTFDDVISYFYFGKGLGNISISGMLFSDCTNNFPGLTPFTQAIGNLRGTTQTITFGSAWFHAVLSGFTVRVASDNGMQNAIEFNLQMDVVDHSFRKTRAALSC